MRRSATWVLLISTVLGVSGCAASLGQVAMVSTRPLKMPGTTLRRAVLGQDCASNLIGIPLGKSAPTLDDAVSAAVGQVAGGTLLTNVTMENAYWTTGLYNIDCIKVQGDVIGGK